MRIWLYSIVRDEAPILPYFLRHYTPWVERLIFYDDHSTDGTRGLIQGCSAAELRDWPGTHGIVDDEFTQFANEQWKEARGHVDWIIWCDADEFLYHPDIIGVLEHYIRTGVELPRIAGYTMVSDRFPTTPGQIHDEIKTGFFDPCWCKNAIFRGDIHWNVGRHSVNLGKFTPRMSRDADIKLLHYRCLGLEYLKARHARNWARVPDYCRSRNYGNNCSPGWDGHHGVKWFEEVSKGKLETVI